MFSKFDTNIQSDELAPVEPTQADWEEYHAWLEEQEAAEPELPPMDFDPHRDFYAEMEDDPYDLLSDPWEDTYDDPADMYEWDCDLHNEF